MKKQCLLSMSLLMTLSMATTLPVYASTTDHLLINQVYGTGGKTEYAVSHNFIELYNPTENDISLAGYEIIYNDETLDLNDEAIIKSSCSYLIIGDEAEESTPALEIVKYDANYNFKLNNKEYTIELKKDDQRVDSLQTEDADESSDGIEGKTVIGISKQKSVRRISFDDTDDNSKDFEIIQYKGIDNESLQINRPRSLADGAWTNEVSDDPIQEETSTVNTKSENGVLNYLGSYSTGATNEDGGVAEIVKYNTDNKKMYLVSGQFQSVDIVSLESTVTDKENEYKLEKRLDIHALAKEHNFTCSDITSVDINTKLDIIGIAVQGEKYTDNGSIVLFDYDGNYLCHFEAGVQPDMITFTKDGKYALTANEGEPREGYDNGADPKGSITVLTLNNNITSSTVHTYDFSKFDNQRKDLINDGVILKKNTAPSLDLEPEYIAVTEDSQYAYVSLQEANSIATFNLSTMEWESIKGLGFKDHNAEGNELDLNKNSKINIQKENVYGVYMPDGLASMTIDGVNYILTPNEGDAREWEEYTDIKEDTINGSKKKVELLDNNEFDGLDSNKTYTFGGRSFSIFRADDMSLVYDSGSDFERKVAELYPTIFNSNHKELEIDGRSNKKGIEPEDVKTLIIGNKTYAFIGLERAGGLMMYDVSNPSNSKYVDYLNIRNMTNGEINNGSDLGAEGISVIEAKDSPNGYPMVLVANEVSGTVSVMYINEGYMSKTEQAAAKLNDKIKGMDTTINDNNKEDIVSLIAEYDNCSDEVKALISSDNVKKIESWKEQLNPVVNENDKVENKDNVDIKEEDNNQNTDTSIKDTSNSTNKNTSTQVDTSDHTSLAAGLGVLAAIAGMIFLKKKKHLFK